MLKLINLFENFDLAKYILDNCFEYNKKDLDKMLPHFRASNNIIYPYRMDKKVRFLRIAPINEKDIEQVQAEMKYILYLIDNGYRAVVPVATKNGNFVEQVDTPYGQYVISCFECADGISLDDTDLGDKIMVSYGKALGELHSLSKQYNAQGAKRLDYAQKLDWAINVFTNYECDSDLVGIAQEIKQQMSQLPITSDNYGLIHYDFQTDNVFYNKKSNKCTVIDFDDCMYGWYALDIMRVYDSLEQALDGKELVEAKQEFMRGYQENAQVAQEQLTEHTDIFAKFVDILTCASLIYSMGEELPDDRKEEWVAVLCDKLINIVNSLVIKLKGEDKVLEEMLQLGEDDLFDNQCD